MDLGGLKNRFKYGAPPPAPLRQLSCLPCVSLCSYSQQSQYSFQQTRQLKGLSPSHSTTAHLTAHRTRQLNTIHPGHSTTQWPVHETAPRIPDAAALISEMFPTRKKNSCKGKKPASCWSLSTRGRRHCPARKPQTCVCSCGAQGSVH